jgi:hypothetical protein
MLRGLILAIILGGATLFGQMQLQNNTADYVRSLLSSNSINQVLIANDTAWFATSRGLNYSGDGGRRMGAFTSSQYGGRGGIAGLNAGNNGEIWIGIGADTLISDEEFPVGQGIAFKKRGESDWQYYPQPRDPITDTDADGFSPELGYYPTTTTVSNITYDLLITENFVWSAGFGGGLRRADYLPAYAGAAEFEVITIDDDIFDALGNLKHRVFSLAGDERNVFVGSAGGVGYSADEGATWRVSAFSATDTSSLPANFIVSLAYDQRDSSIWAGCIETGLSGELRGLAFSRNNGLSWQRKLAGLWVYSVNFADTVVYAATDEGLYISYDGGSNWSQSGRVRDYQTDEVFASSVTYAVAAQDINGGVLWLGAPDGLALRESGFWRIFRSYSPAAVNGEEAIYAYPNPFFPKRRDFVRFQYRAVRSGQVALSLYNYSMEKVIEINENVSGNSEYPDRSIKWDGRDASGSLVANGIYFFRATTPDGVYWGKLVIIE